MYYELTYIIKSIATKCLFTQCNLIRLIVSVYIPWICFCFRKWPYKLHVFTSLIFLYNINVNSLSWIVPFLNVKYCLSLKLRQNAYFSASNYQLWWKALTCDIFCMALTMASSQLPANIAQIITFNSGNTRWVMQDGVGNTVLTKEGVPFTITPMAPLLPDMPLPQSLVQSVISSRWTWTYQCNARLST